MSEALDVLLQRLPHADGLPAPAPATPGSAGYDVASADEVELAPGARALVRTGFAIAVPEGYECQIRPRSGLALKHGVTLPNTPATVDSDYRGELKVVLVNHGDEPFRIAPGDRVAQLLVQRVERVRFTATEQVADTARGSGGFGSTGR